MKTTSTLPALLIVDMQQGMASAKAGRRNNPHAEQHIAQLLALWRALKAPLVHIRHLSTTPSSLFWPGQSGVEFQPALAPLPGEQVIDKSVPDAFVRPGLTDWLHTQSVTHVIIAGVSTNISVESCARSASNLGFTVTVISDACFAFDRVSSNGQVTDANLIHTMSLANLEGEFATLSSTAHLLARIAAV
jgi:nicotinamidase-related amidase